VSSLQELIAETWAPLYSNPYKPTCHMHRAYWLPIRHFSDTQSSAVPGFGSGSDAIMASEAWLPRTFVSAFMVPAEPVHSA